jgi:perosamine synthetase
MVRPFFPMSSTKQTVPDVRMAKPFNDETIEKCVLSILRSGMLVQGVNVKQFESKLAEYIGCQHVVAVNSGTAALHLAILACALKHGQSRNEPEVVTSPFSFAATANAAIHAGCVPVFADIDPETFNLDADSAAEKVSENTVAIEPVDVYGLPADLAAFERIARKHGISVVEDAAESIGANYEGKKIGNVSDVSCFSTYATKNLHTAEGGFITTDRDQLAEKLRMMRNQGQSTRYNQIVLGYNFRMLEFCAVIGLEQLKILDELNGKRRENVARLKESLTKIDSLSFQKVQDPESHSWYLFSLTLDERKAGISRDKLVSKLKERGVEADVAWPTPIHLQPYFRERYGFKEGDFPNAEKLCTQIFQVPIHPFLSDDDLDRVSANVKDILVK